MTRLAVPVGLAALGLLPAGCGGTVSSRGTEPRAHALDTPATPLKYPGRAFAGAPPVVPHEVEEKATDGDCLDCHLRGEGDDDAPAVAHPAMVHCRSCHVSRVAKGGPSGRFIGRRFGFRGDRATLTAPPTIPHRAGQLHRECLACHAGPVLRGPETPHPGRLPCMSCHVSGVGSLQ